jgi:hypothetical protein
MLRGYQFREPAYPLEPYLQPPRPGSLPVLPSDDVDERMCVFSAAECARWFELTDILKTEVPHYRRLPVDWMTLGDDEADEFVRSMLKSLDAMREMSLAEPRMVTFIG